MCEGGGARDGGQGGGRSVEQPITWAPLASPGTRAQLAGQNETVRSMFTLPAEYLDASRLRGVGVVLAHGADAEDWRGPLLEPLAAQFARAGHVVMRYHCAQKEMRRLRIFEKALDVAASSPFARGVTRWVLVGYDNGARVVATAGLKPRACVAAGRCRPRSPSSHGSCSRRSA